MSRPSNEVYARYHARAYLRYELTFHKERDRELIEFLEAQKAAGLSPTATVRELYRAYMAAQDAGVYFG